MIRAASKLVTLMSILAVLSVPLPAAAGGGLSFTFSPKGEDAVKLRRGLAALTRAQELRNAARVSQRGSGNGAGISQSGGSGNVAGIIQAGRGNSATITQNGSGNSYGIIQVGRNRTSNVVQNGNGGTGLTLQLGR